jgi:hypothetical protein
MTEKNAHQVLGLSLTGGRWSVPDGIVAYSRLVLWDVSAQMQAVASRKAFFCRFQRNLSARLEFRTGSAHGLLPGDHWSNL